MIQTLTCQTGNHTWQRESSRGRKPKFCPVHDPRNAEVAPVVSLNDGNTETLICQHGDHTWSRPKTRGRKPPFCPEHRPLQSVPSVILDPDNPESDRPEFSLGSVVVRNALVQRVLDTELSPCTHDNATDPLRTLKEKLTYVVRELENPKAWRELGDWNGLLYTHKRLTQEAARLFQTTVNYEALEAELEEAA